MTFSVLTRTVWVKTKRIAHKPVDPVKVEIEWEFYGSTTPTIWTYGTGGQVVKLGVGCYVVTVPTRTATSTKVVGKWIGSTGACTVVQPFTFRIAASPI